MSTQNEPAGPRLSSVLFVGLLCLILGKFLGLASLISQPVAVMSKNPDPESIEPGKAYYVKGDRLGGTNWRGKEEAIKSGLLESISLSEGDLNRWSSSRLKAPKAPPATEEAGWKDRVKLSCSPVNFNILEDRIQMVTEVQIGDIFKDRTFTYLVSGTFESTKNGVRFVPQDGSLGQAPLGKISPTRKLLFSLVGNGFAQLETVDWLPESFDNLESIDIVEGQLILRMRAAG